MSFAAAHGLQARSSAAVARGEVDTGMHPVPDAVDRRVAEAFRRLPAAPLRRGAS